MRIKHLQQLDIAGEHADEIAFPFPSSLAGQSLRSGKHMVADERQQRKAI